MDFDSPVVENMEGLERALDRLFKAIGIDIEFTKHFFDRVNDERNKRQITVKELAQLYAKEFQKWGKVLAKLTPRSEAVLKDLNSDINIPFVMRWDRQSKELDLIAKTVLRKKGFSSKDREFPV